MRLNRCDCCGRKFGLVLQRLWTRRFCCRLCKKVYQVDKGHPRAADIARGVSETLDQVKSASFASRLRSAGS